MASSSWPRWCSNVHYAEWICREVDLPEETASKTPVLHEENALQTPGVSPESDQLLSADLRGFKSVSPQKYEALIIHSTTARARHIEASKEIPRYETPSSNCPQVIKNSPSIKTLDITGGAPELNEHFRYMVEQGRALDVEVIDRYSGLCMRANPSRSSCFS